MLSDAVVVLDFETTGLNPRDGARGIEVGAVKLINGEIVDRYSSLINPGVRIPYHITELTGISDDMIANAPQPAEVYPDLLDFIGDAYLVAHNAGFDAKFLAAEAAALGLQSSHRDLICTVMLTRRLQPKLASYSLAKLASYLDIKFPGAAHRALADAEVAAEVLLFCARQLRQDYQLEQVEPGLLCELNQQTPARALSFLRKKLLPQTLPKAIQAKAMAQRYRHYKGGIYEVICRATQEADLMPVIVYKAANGTIWTRAESVFFEIIEVDGKKVQRFTPIS